jgi:flagellar hook-associated protein FlgK
MASLFEIGKTGVQAYRQSLSVTGQNIANINTEGYNKRSANVTEVAGVSGGPTNVSDQSGLGVRVDNIRRSFDTFLADKTSLDESKLLLMNRETDSQLNRWGNLNDEKLYRAGLAGYNFGTTSTWFITCQCFCTRCR